MNKKNIIPVIVGPTASGKSSLSIEFARQKNLEIISADSMQIYKNLNIGTAKVSIEEQNVVKHHLINILNESDSYSVYQFQNDARQIISKNNANILICGGSSQYVCSLLDDEVYINDTNLELRRDLENKFNNFTNDDLWTYLNSIDEQRASKLEKNDRRRIFRAIEKYIITGTKPSKLDPKLLAKKKNKGSGEIDISDIRDMRDRFNTKNESDKYKQNYSFVCFYIDIDREILYERINNRVDKMIQDGLIAEASYCYELNVKGKLSNTCKQAIAYKEFFPYFAGICSLEKCIEQLKINSRHYAKRQITWWKKRKKYVLNGLKNKNELAQEMERVIVEEHTNID